MMLIQLLLFSFSILTVSESQLSPACPQGQYWNLNSDACELCPMGTYKDMDNVNITSCEPCPDGQTTLIEGATHPDFFCITDCPPGQEYNHIDDNCTLCRLEQYRDENVQVCYYCPPGYTSLSEGATRCDPTNVTLAPVIKRVYTIKTTLLNIRGQDKSSMKQYAIAVMLAYVTQQRQRYRGLCQMESCEDVDISIDVLLPEPGKQKADADVQITFRNIDSRLHEYENADHIRDFDKVIQEIFYETITITGPATCPPGSLKDSLNGFCLECGSGSFSNRETNHCEACPKNTYSTDPVSDKCASCPDGLVTSGAPAGQLSECDDPCTFIDDYCGVAGECVQSESGLHFCKCDSLHEGPRCGQKTGNNEDSKDDNIALIVSLSVAGVVVIFIIALLILFVRKRIKKKDEQLSRSSSSRHPSRLATGEHRPKRRQGRNSPEEFVSPQTMNPSHPNTMAHNEYARFTPRHMKQGPVPFSQHQNFHMRSIATPSQAHYHASRQPKERQEQVTSMEFDNSTYVDPDDYDYIAESKLYSSPSRHIPVDHEYSEAIVFP